MDQVEGHSVWGDGVVCELEAMGGVDHQGCDVVTRQGLSEGFDPAQETPQITSIHMFHGQEWDASLKVKIEYLDDVGMNNRTQHSSFIDQGLDEGLVVRKLGQDPFEGDLPSEAQGALHLGQVNLGHSAQPNAAEQAIASKVLWKAIRLCQ